MADVVHIRRALDGDVDAITEVYNEAILTTTATFDTETKSVDDRRAWLAAHDECYPVLVLESDGEIAGWASLSAWSDRKAYSGTAETTYYVHSRFRGRGFGTRLKQALIDEARRLGLHTLIARVANGSDASEQICKRAGFSRVGTMHQVGYKFDRYIDVHIYQLML